MVNARVAPLAGCAPPGLRARGPHDPAASGSAWGPLGGPSAGGRTHPPPPAVAQTRVDAGAISAYTGGRGL